MLASGVCHSDLHVRDGEWDRPTPIVMGHEGAGIVEAVGSGVDSPGSVSWSRCRGSFRAASAGRAGEGTCGRAQTPRHTGTSCSTGPRRSPAPANPFAPTARSRRWPKRSWCRRRPRSRSPTGTNPAAAALIGCCVTTGVGAVLKTAAVPAGSSVAVIGLGGVGLSCVMGA